MRWRDFINREVYLLHWHFLYELYLKLGKVTRAEVKVRLLFDVSKKFQVLIFPRRLTGDFGFVLITYLCLLSAVCGAPQTANVSGTIIQTISSPGYPAAPPPNVRCLWFIESPVVGGNIKITFQDINLSGDPPCNGLDFANTDLSLLHIVREVHNLTVHPFLQFAFAMICKIRFFSCRISVHSVCRCHLSRYVSYHSIKVRQTLYPRNVRYCMKNIISTYMHPWCKCPCIRDP